MKHKSIFVVLVAFASCINADGAAFNVQAFLSQFKPGTAHEALPHGVPTGYDWQSESVGGTPSRPMAENTHMNLWGQVYVNTTNYHAPNVRVEVKSSQFWILWDSRWMLGYKTDDLGGGSWKEDYTANGGTFDMKTEPDGGHSFVPHNQYVAHFWPEVSYVAAPTVPRAVLSIAFTRLVLDDPSGADNRSSSAYIIGMGADWRKPDGSCPNDICSGVGVGRMIIPNRNWRVVVMSTMSTSELSSLPMPPDSIFKMPDGTYPDGTTPSIPRIAGKVKTMNSDLNLTYFRLDGSCVRQGSLSNRSVLVPGIYLARNASGSTARSVMAPARR